MRRVFAVPVAACLVLLAVGGTNPVAAQGCEFPCLVWTWPLEFQASYNETSQVLTLWWQPPEGVASVEEYVLYRDGVEVARPTVTQWSESLASWDDEGHFFEVSAVVDGDEGAKTLPITVSKLRLPGLLNCSIIGITTTLSPPGVYPGIHWECLPP